MKSALSTIIIIGFAAIAAFGIFAMNHSGGHNPGCIATAVRGVADCPSRINPFAFFAFHLDAFRSFSTATVGSPLASASLIALTLVLISFLILLSVLSGKTSPSFLKLQARRRKRQESFAFPFHRGLTRWLALHENSPSAI